MIQAGDFVSLRLNCKAEGLTPGTREKCVAERNKHIDTIFPGQGDAGIEQYQKEIQIESTGQWYAKRLFALQHRPAPSEGPSVDSQ